LKAVTSPIINLEQQLLDVRTEAEAQLSHCLPDPTRPPRRLHEAMRYASLGGGKRLRAALVYFAGGLFGLRPAELAGPACAVELIHAYSLVHDDLPAMDDDDLRRGKPTLHRAYDEATAILAGDALQALAFQVLMRGPAGAADAATRLDMCERLAIAAGAAGMVGGQAMDLEAEGKQLDLAQLESLHVRKTGALIRCSVTLGALAAGSAGRDGLAALDGYGQALGLAFQIQDDILDVSGNTAELGKHAGADQSRNKATYPALLGLSEASTHAIAMIDQALAALAPFGPEAEPLRALARYVVTRRH